MDYDELATKILDTYVLGEYVGAAWNLEQVMRWVPPHGGLVAHRLFHTRLLPHLTAVSVLPISDSIRAAATEASKAYGGPEAPLTRSPGREGAGKSLYKPMPDQSEAMRMPLGEFAHTGAKKPFPSGPPRLPPPPGSIRRIQSPPWKRQRGAGLVSKRLKGR
ncbi:hypothetical protein FRC17_004236 [Serendipita sp. 399]|nr:hypothetical protein FRC17_004236 [Serendipita sp. 399]